MSVPPEQILTLGGLWMNKHFAHCDYYQALINNIVVDKYRQRHAAGLFKFHSCSMLALQ